MSPPLKPCSQRSNQGVNLNNVKSLSTISTDSDKEKRTVGLTQIYKSSGGSKYHRHSSEIKFHKASHLTDNTKANLDPRNIEFVDSSDINIEKKEALAEFYALMSPEVKESQTGRKTVGLVCIRDEKTDQGSKRDYGTDVEKSVFETCWENKHSFTAEKNNSEIIIGLQDIPHNLRQKNEGFSNESFHATFGSSEDRCTLDLSDSRSKYSDLTSSSGSRPPRPGSAKRCPVNLESENLQPLLDGDLCKSDADPKRKKQEQNGDQDYTNESGVNSVHHASQTSPPNLGKGTSDEHDRENNSEGIKCSEETIKPMLGEILDEERYMHNMLKMKAASRKFCRNQRRDCSTATEIVGSSGTRADTGTTHEASVWHPSRYNIQLDMGKSLPVTGQVALPPPFYSADFCGTENVCRGKSRDHARRYALWRPQKAKLFFDKSPATKLPPLPKGLVPTPPFDANFIAKCMDLNLVYPQMPPSQQPNDDSFFPTEHRLGTSANLNRAMKQKMADDLKRPLLFKSDRVLRDNYFFQDKERLYELFDNRLMPPWKPTRGDLQVKYRDVMSRLNREAFSKWLRETDARAGNPDVKDLRQTSTNKKVFTPNRFRDLSREKTDICGNVEKQAVADDPQETDVLPGVALDLNKEEKSFPDNLNSDGGGDEPRAVKDEPDSKSVTFITSRSGDTAEVSSRCQCRSCSKAAHWINSSGHTCFNLFTSRKAKSDRQAHDDLGIQLRHQRGESVKREEDEKSQCLLYANQESTSQHADIEKKSLASRNHALKNNSLQSWEIRRLDRMLNQNVIQSGMRIGNAFPL